MEKKGSITIYLCLMLSVFLLLFQVIYRSVRIAGARTQLSVGIHQSLYSVFARYDPVLLEQYGLLFVDGSFGGEKFRQDLLCDCIYQGMKEGSAAESGWKKNIWGLRIDHAGLTGYTLATDRKGEAFRLQAVEVMKENLGSQGIRSLLELVEGEREILENQDEIHSGEANEEVLENYESDLKELKKEQEEEGEELQTPAEPVENPIDVIRKIWKKGVLGLVVKDLENLSEESFEKQELVSGRTLEKGFGLQVLPKERGITEKLLFQEYLLEYLSCYTDEGAGNRYELEYVLKGKEKDEENLKGVVSQLLLIREASNFAHLLTDGSKRAQASAMAAAISASIGLPVAKGLIQKALQACWAFGESVLDVRTLLDGGKVPLVKTEGFWQLELDQLVHLADGLDSLRKEQEEGLDYRGYLRILLLAVNEEKQVMRGMDMVEYGMREREGKESFRLDHCIGQLEAQAEAEGGGIRLSVSRGYGYGET